MFSRYTESSQRVIVLAQDEARRLNFGFVGTGVLLLGILRLQKGVAWTALLKSGVDPEWLRQTVISLMGTGQGAVRGEIGFTPAAKRVMVEYSINAARQMGTDYVGTEHLLLGLLQDEGHAGEALRAAGLTREGLEAVVRGLMGTGDPPETATPVREPIPYSQALMAALRSAMYEARTLGAGEVLPEHLLMAFLTVPAETSVRSLLLQHGLTLAELRGHLSQDE